MLLSIPFSLSIAASPAGCVSLLPRAINIGTRVLLVASSTGVGTRVLQRDCLEKQCEKAGFFAVALITLPNPSARAILSLCIGQEFQF
jgi:hypothetical protein